MKVYFRSLMALFILALSARAIAQTPSAAIQLNEEDIVWKEAGPNLPQGSKVCVLEGNPKAEGIFSMRVWIPAGAMLKPHTHPREERVTVISGFVRVAFSETIDYSKGALFGPGAYYVNPPQAPHFVWTTTGAIVQITGIGPWEIHFLGE